MEEQVRSALDAIGMANAKALFFVHTDEDYPHIHIVASKINPETGRAYDLKGNYLQLSSWAEKYEAEHGGIISLKRATNNELRAAISARDTGAILEALTKQRATFTPAQLESALAKQIKNESERAEFGAKILAQPQIVQLADTPGGPIVRYSTQAVIEAELHVLRAAAGLVRDRSHGIDETRRGAVLAGEQFAAITAEQERAFRHATGAEGLALIDGQAGTGKSYTIAAVRAAYEADGRTVIGLAPTNTVAQDMATDGFGRAATIHSELFALNSGRRQWDAKTVVIVDEAAMLDTKLMAMVTAHAHEARAKLVLVGDDRQLSSIDRGGMFGALKDRYGAAALSEVKRQHKLDERRASEWMAEGNYHDSLNVYDRMGAIHWTRTQGEARAALIAQWAKDSAAQPDKTRFVFAYTNDDVDTLNAGLRAVRKQRGELGPDSMLETAHGHRNFAPGDRILFTGTDKKQGITNGRAGTIEAIEGSHVTVALDGRQAKTITVDAAAFNQIRHGYAGTIYKAQGRTLDQTYLYHSEHWRSAASYVALTRHRDKAELFVATNTARDVKELARQMGRTDDRRAASQFHHAPEISTAELTAAELHARFSTGAVPPQGSDISAKARGPHERDTPAKTEATAGTASQPPQIAPATQENLDRPERRSDLPISAEEAKQMDRERQFGTAAFDTTEPDAQLRDAWRQKEFSKQTIEADPWTAVYLAVPENADPWLLLHAQGVVHDCEKMIERGPGAGPRLQQGIDGPNENLQRAGRRALDLEELIEEHLKRERPRPERPDISDTLAQSISEPFGLGERVVLRAAEQIGDRLGKAIEFLADSVAPPPPPTQEQAELTARAAQEAAEARERAAPQQEWDAARGKEIDEAVRQQQNEQTDFYQRYGLIRDVDQPRERDNDERGRSRERDRD
jgi:Ti-type conjugative transfer relaxase TraA